MLNQLTKRVLWGGLFIVALLLLLQSPFPNRLRGAAASGDIIPGRYIVVLNEDVEAEREVDDIELEHGILAAEVYTDALEGFAANLSRQDLDDLKKDPRVAFIEPDRIVTAFPLPTGIDRIDADLNATSDIDGSGPDLDIDIAVIDTGISTSHPDLRVAGGKRFTGSSCSGTSFNDDNGHGSHVAGTIAARDNGNNVLVNGTPTAVPGVAPGARLWAVKVLNRNGSGSFSCVIAGVNWVTGRAAEFNDGPGDGDPGINIAAANMSLGGGSSAALCTAIANSVAAGVFYAVAAGNSAANAANTSPANCADVLSTSAIADFNGAPGGGAAPTCRSDVDDTFADFSNFGSVVDIAAPGVCILSTYSGSNYAIGSGTSMASPHVAGAAAIYILANSLNPADAAGVAAVRSGLLSAAATQDSPCGFTGDPDTFPEPLVWLGTPCVAGPDLTPPETTITSAPSNPSNSSSPSFSFTSNEPGSTFQCSLDGALPSPCTSPTTYSGLADGPHTFQVAATDNPAGNTDPTPASHSWTIDTLPPDTTITSAPPNPSDSSTASFSFTANEAGSSFQCQLDGGAFSSCTSPRTYSGLANGSHTFQVRATDPAGNADPTPASFTWTVDVPVPPVTVTILTVNAGDIEQGDDYNIRANVHNDGTATVTVTVQALVSDGSATQTLSRTVTIAPGATVQVTFNDASTLPAGTYLVTVTVVEDPDVGSNNTATFVIE